MTIPLPFHLIGVFLSLSLHSTISTPISQVHIVYLGRNHGHDPLLTEKTHLNILSNVFTEEEDAKRAILYNYVHGFSGFAAMINSTQASSLASMEGVISVFRSKKLRLHTTRSWDFMGLAMGNDQEASSSKLMGFGDDVVVGILDTGIWPESESFREEAGMRPVPPAWKGACVKGEHFDPAKACNRKLIGARYYLKGFEHDYGPLNTTGEAEYRSPRDRLGHGTHTASTAVGSAAGNASFFGLGRGTARGGAPRARLAVYKVCWLRDLQQAQCSDADILAAFDDALRDGVHVISASLGASPPLVQFFRSSTDIGSFHAAQMGVVVVFSAGNDGPEPSLVQNVAPWGVCVAAGTIDRNFPTQVRLGNNVSFVGEGFIARGMKMKLIDSGKLFDDGYCTFENWRGRELASGKIVLCFSSVGQISSGTAALAVLAINGSGMIFAETLTRVSPQDDLLPTVHVNLNQATQIFYYILSSENPTVQVFPSTTAVGGSPAPSVAYFSSRGPSSASPNILKPDIAAPGVNILAAWSPRSSPTLLPFDRRSVNWNFDSGTSMACPHVSGIVALVKSAHPDWSPAAIKSALMTTAYNLDVSSDTILAGGTLKPVDPFDIGAGHVNPLKATDPGLVYDMDARDYVAFLCSMGYDESQIKRMVLPAPSVEVRCSKDGSTRSSDTDVNYPAVVVSDLRSAVTVRRTVRNVGARAAVYFASVVSPAGVHAAVWPTYLVFTCRNEERSYHVTVRPLKRSAGRYDFGEIVWFDGYHRVRIPLVVCVNDIIAAARDGHSARIHSS